MESEIATQLNQEITDLLHEEITYDTFMGDSMRIISVIKSGIPYSLFNLIKDYTPFPASTQKIGNDFISEKLFCVLKIPSLVTQGDFNFLINPNHKDFDRILVSKMDKFPFDNRIFK